MSFEIELDPPPVEEVLNTYPMMPDIVGPQRQSIMRIIEGVDERLMVILGPCSFFPTDKGVEHAKRMSLLRERHSDVLELIERVYSIKPRTDNGWGGIQFEPHPEMTNGGGGVNIIKGIYATRDAMSKVVPHMPIADEILNPDLKDYFDDLLAYGAMGARNATVMRDRRAAAGMDFPIGMKHDLSGDIETAVKGVKVAQTVGNRLILSMKQQRASGNPHAHVILRGSEKNGPNWDPASIKKASDMLHDAKLKNPSVIVDCSHGNCIDPRSGDKTIDRQKHVIERVIRNMFCHSDSYRDFKGIMFESFLLPGNQKPSPEMNMDGLSITDKCIGIEDTEVIVDWIADEVRRRK